MKEYNIYILAFILSILLVSIFSCTKDYYCECEVKEVVNHKAAVSCLDGHHIIYNELNYKVGDCIKLDN